MKKVLAFFGAFNPPTKAHIELAKYAMEQTNYEGVILVPSKTSYIINDQHKDFAINSKHRIEMLKEIVANNSLWLSYCLYDIYSNIQPRTYETLLYLKKQRNLKPKLLIGMDQYLSMENGWKNVENIAKEFGIVVLQRENYEQNYKNSDFYNKIAQYTTIISTSVEYKNISSTNARHYLKTIEDNINELKNIVPIEVFEYLMEVYIRDSRSHY